MSEWISVKLKPTPRNGYFLAYTNKRGLYILFQTSKYECLLKDNSYHTVDVKDITHWQPLPEPPEEE